MTQALSITSLIDQHAEHGGEAGALVETIIAQQKLGGAPSFASPLNLAIRQAARHQCEDIVQELNRQIEDKPTRLFILSSFLNHIPKDITDKMTDLIISSFKDVINDPLPGIGMTPIFLAMNAEAEGKKGVLQCMLDHGADPTQTAQVVRGMRTSAGYQHQANPTTAIEEAQMHIAPLIPSIPESRQQAIINTNQRWQNIVSMLQGGARLSR